MTSDSTVVSLRQPEETEDPLTAVLRKGARQLLRKLSFRRVAVRPQHPQSQPEAQAVFSVGLPAS